MSLEGPEFGINECLYEISKDMGGRIYLVDAREDKCERLDCVSFKILHRLEFQLSSHMPCDSNVAKPLDGKLIAKIIHGLVKNGEGRGAYHGKFKLIGDSGTLVQGRLWGITNAGTHRDPIGECESCDRKGHIEGHLAGEIYEGEKSLIDCRVFGSYAINFDHSIGFGTTHAKGVLEGVIVCECESQF